jgi:hypothetical protein
MCRRSALFLLPVLALAPVPALGVGVIIDQESESLSVTVEAGTTVEEGLQALGEAYGFAVSVRGDTGVLPASRFRADTVADAVRRIGRGYQLVIRHEAGLDDEPSVSSVVLLGRGGGPPPGTIRVSAGSRRIDRSTIERLVAIASLADRPPEEAIPELADIVESDPVPATRAAAIRALASLADAAAWPVIDVGLVDRDASVRLAALRAQPPDRGDFPYATIETMAGSDRDAHVRELARNMLDEHYAD